MVQYENSVLPNSFHKSLIDHNSTSRCQPKGASTSPRHKTKDYIGIVRALYMHI